jgi:hypothetical protein
MSYNETTTGIQQAIATTVNANAFQFNPNLHVMFFGISVDCFTNSLGSSRGVLFSSLPDGIPRAIIRPQCGQFAIIPNSSAGNSNAPSQN